MHLLRKRTVGHLALLMASVLFVVACGAPPSPPTPVPPTPAPPTPAPPPPSTTVDIGVRAPVGTVTWQYTSPGLWGPGQCVGPTGFFACVLTAPVGSATLPDVGDQFVSPTYWAMRSFANYRLRGAGPGPTIPPGAGTGLTIIENASLIVFQGSLSSNPWTTGPIVISHLDYLDDGFLGAGDFFQTTIAGPITVSTTGIIGSRTVDVTGFVANAQLREPRDPVSDPSFPAQTVYVGFRLEWGVTDPASFNGFNTDADMVSDWVEYTFSILRVTYR